MKKHTEFMDPITDPVLYNIDPEVHDTLSTEQLLAFRNAIRAVIWRKKHLMDFRGILPLYFIKFYYSFFMGLDHRRNSYYFKKDRRFSVSKLKSVLFLLFVSLSILSLVGFVVYLMIYVAPESTLQNYPTP
ncbi:hypothetical protein WDW89_11915 [Deltaproteobacteria bacterium TL4]